MDGDLEFHGEGRIKGGYGYDVRMEWRATCRTGVRTMLQIVFPDYDIGLAFYQWVHTVTDWTVLVPDPADASGYGPPAWPAFADVGVPVWGQPVSFAEAMKDARAALIAIAEHKLEKARDEADHLDYWLNWADPYTGP